MTAPTISVAMATYNGAKYLREQLDSIAAQTSLPDELVIGDDGSTDETLEIIQDFAKTAPFPVRVKVNERNLGFADNFLSTATRCKSDWVAFCDQDDIWLPFKLGVVREAISSTQISRPKLMFHDFHVCQDATAKVGSRQPKNIPVKIFPARSHRCFWVVRGMSQIVCRETLQSFDWRQRPFGWSNPHRLLSHDRWTCALANAIGPSVHVGVSCAVHRRHERNESGEPEVTWRQAQNLLHSYSTSGKERWAEAYCFRAKKLEEMSNFFQLLASKDSGANATNLLRYARLLNLCADIYMARSNLWRGGAHRQRLRHFESILFGGGYWGREKVVSNPRSLIKDLVALIL